MDSGVQIFLSEKRFSMSTYFTPFAVLWAMIALTVLGLLVYRRMVASHDDETLHLSGADTAIQQSVIAHKLEVIDKWGKLLTAIAVVYGLILAGLYTYYTWLSSGTTVGL